MRPLLQVIPTAHTPESLAQALAEGHGLVLLRSAMFESPHARYSFVAAAPFLTFRSAGSRCEVRSDDNLEVQFGNPWHLLDALMARYELLDEIDLPFPLGGCFGYWGYDLKNFVEPRLTRRAVNDLELPDCHVGFYDSLVVFDHHENRVCVVSTGLAADGSRDAARAQARLEAWQARLAAAAVPSPDPRWVAVVPPATAAESAFFSSSSEEEFLAAVQRAQQYIVAGDIYQVNLSHRLGVAAPMPGWTWFQRLLAASPAPFAAYLDCGDFQIVSSSPELFLRLSGSQMVTRPIKGTRPRSPDAAVDARLAAELQASGKERAELVMITDLLRNDLGKVCEFGSVQVPELARLERFSQVQHLVSTVEGRLRGDVTHFRAFASSFPGGSITGAPKIRAMEIIDELEPLARGPYTGCHGYLGFNRESQLSISIRTGIRKSDVLYFQVGAGIVADSEPGAEYEETLAKGRGFFASLAGAGSDETPVKSASNPN